MVALVHHLDSIYEGIMKFIGVSGWNRKALIKLKMERSDIWKYPNDLNIAVAQVPMVSGHLRLNFYFMGVCFLPGELRPREITRSRASEIGLYFS
ncbi:MAG: hypothetical protein B2I17_00160 [Thermoplasmatales archaeon B_DKE]|nr:MAG: hypothetical protein B2I17_00160 [Thermoplasmatales archaeon B_DKE]